MNNEDIEKVSESLARILIARARYVLEHGQDADDYQEEDRIDDINEISWRRDK